MSAPARATSAEHEAAQVAIVTRAVIKSVLVDLLLRLPSYRVQRLAAGLVRGLWPGFREA